VAQGVGPSDHQQVVVLSSAASSALVSGGKNDSGCPCRAWSGEGSQQVQWAACWDWWKSVWEEEGGNPFVAVVGALSSLSWTSLVERADPKLPYWLESALG